MWTKIIEKTLDPYSLKARLFPGLLLLLPVIVFLLTVFGPKAPVLTGLCAALVTCGGPYTLASFVRTYGQRAQENLYKAWGGKPTTILLRHIDKRLASGTKRQYHELIKTKFGLQVPSAADERQNAAASDEVYSEAADLLIRATRDTKSYPLVFKELTEYGFKRNCYGVRWIGAVVALATITVMSIRIKAGIPLQGWPSLYQGIVEIPAAEGLSLCVAFVLACAWLFHFTSRTVLQAGFSYAERLCEALAKIPHTPIAKVKGAAKVSGAD